MQKKEKKFLKKPINGTKFTLAISSAKGGVGKSTFAINFASALSLLGKKVGVLDADVFGPSLSKLMDIQEKPVIADNKQIEPINKFNLQCMSMGFLVDENTPMIWRGPMVISAIKTLTEKVNWHDLDFIIVDMPPGTGDTQLTFAQDIKIDGAIIISTPQELALADVKRGIQMFDRTEIPIIGLIDNMSSFSADGKTYNIFGEGGVEKAAKEFNKKFLGKIPLDIDLRKSADEGQPLVNKNKDHSISKIFLDLAKKITEGFQ